jgi:hypothetical protein
MKPLQGIFIAPALGAFIATFAMCLTPEVASHQFGSVLITYSIVGAIFGIISALLFGWPISLVFQRFKLIKLWHFILGGFVCALPFWVAWFYPFNSGHWDAKKYTNSIYFFSVGILSGATYWFLVIRTTHTNE